MAARSAASRSMQYGIRSIPLHCKSRAFTVVPVSYGLVPKIKTCSPDFLLHLRQLNTNALHCLCGLQLPVPQDSDANLLPRWTVNHLQQMVVSFASSGCSVRCMAGHNKWSNIRHIKAEKDREKAVISSQLSRKLLTFIKETGQTDPKTSSQLAKLIAEAKAKNVPSATVDKILNRMVSMKSTPPTLFEAKGPAGGVMLIEAVTDNMKNCRGQLQSIVKKCGFSMFEVGASARRVFKEKGVVTVSSTGEATPDLDHYTEIAIEAGAEDVTFEEDEEAGKVLQFICEPRDVYAVKKELEAKKLPVQSAEVVFFTTITAPVDQERMELIVKIIEKLEEHPDVLRVITNVEQAS